MARLSIVAAAVAIAPSAGYPPPALRWAPALQPLGASLLVLAVAALCGCATTPVPTDPVTTGCSVGAAEFAGWFQPTSVTAGTVNLNGIANPANSLAFPDTPNCSFYKWSEQMYLWLTSPAPPNYGGGGGHVFQSPVFYDVSPLDASFQRTFIPHTAGVFPNLSLRAAKVGSHGLQVVTARSGMTLDIEPPRFGPSGRLPGVAGAWAKFGPLPWTPADSLRYLGALQVAHIAELGVPGGAGQGPGGCHDRGL